MHFHLTSNIETISGVDKGWAETMREFRVELYDNPQIPLGQMREVWPEGKPVAMGLLKAILTKQKRCIMVVHPDQGDTTLFLLKQAGCEVEDYRYFKDRANK